VPVRADEADARHADGAGVRAGRRAHPLLLHVQRPVAVHRRAGHAPVRRMCGDEDVPGELHTAVRVQQLRHPSPAGRHRRPRGRSVPLRGHRRAHRTESVVPVRGMQHDHLLAVERVLRTPPQDARQERGQLSGQAGDAQAHGDGRHALDDPGLPGGRPQRPAVRVPDVQALRHGPV